MEKEMFEANKNVRGRKLTSTNSINKTNLERNCPIAFTISVIGGRWKLSILALLHDYGALRYSQIRSNLSGISERVLTLQLKELEQFNVISRSIYANVPLRVEYSLTEKGRSLAPILIEMTSWGKKQLDVDL